MFNLSEYRFNDLLAQSISTAVTAATQTLPHFTDVSAYTGGRTGAFHSGTIFLPAVRHVSSNMSPPQLFEIVFATVAGIGRNFSSLSIQIRSDLFQHRSQFMHVTAVRSDLLRHDDLAVRIRCSLTVVALDVTASSPHHTTVAVREIQLRFVFRNTC